MAFLQQYGGPKKSVKTKSRNPIRIRRVKTDSDGSPTDSRDFLIKIINSISDPLFVKDASHRRVLVNEAYCRFMELPAEQLIGKTDRDLYPPNKADRLYRDDQIVLETGRERIVEEIMRGPRSGDRFFVTKKTLYCDPERRKFIVGIARDITNRKQMEEMLMRARANWEETFNTINDAITIHDSEFNIVSANPAATILLNTSQPELSSKKCYQLFHGAACPPAACPSCEVIRTGKPAISEIFEPHLNRFLEIKALPQLNTDRAVTGLIHVVRDITDRYRSEEVHRRLQAQLLQAQKMESVGRLAGGIAHDFNNLLTAMIGYGELTLMKLKGESDPLWEPVKTIVDSGEKAAALTHQLLAFSRKQVLDMRVVNLNGVIDHMAKMLKRLIGEDVMLELCPSQDLGNVKADANQIEQVLMNLAVNARDAMPTGGTLTIGTSMVALDEASVAEYPEIHPGRYALVRVGDTGVGMPRDIQDKIFDPFFTTKDMGKGTGLGLATVYGIVKQHNGYIYVDSEVGRGTTFRMYLPVADEEERYHCRKARSKALGGNETIMVVEDEETIRSLLVTFLRQIGYEVLPAASGHDAIEAIRSHAKTVDALVTDVIMPKMNGKQLAETLKSRYTGLKVLFMSGYADDVIAFHGIRDEPVHFIQKPVRTNDLANKLRQILDGNCL